MYNAKKMFRIVLALAIAVVMSFSGAAVYADTQSDIDKLNRRKSDVLNQKNDAQGLLDDTNRQKSSLLTEVAGLDADLEKSQARLDQINSDLSKTEANLAQARSDLADAEAARANEYDTLKLRLRVMYEDGQSGYVDMLFDSASLSELMNKYEYVSRVISFDDNLFDRLIATEKSVNDNVNLIASKEKEQKVLQDEQQAWSADLKSKIDARNRRVAELSNDAGAYAQQVKDLQGESDQLETQIKAAERKLAEEKAAAEAARKAAEEAARKAAEEAAAKAARERAQAAAAAAQAKAEAAARAAQAEAEAAARAAQAKADIAAAADAPSSGFNGKLAWPFDSRFSVSSDYGNRVSPITGQAEFHTGIDIPAPEGTTVHAAAAGAVIIAKYWGGYGNCVVISHDGDLSTLYGHNSKLLVSVGDYVQKGDAIALCGSTGYATGPHCHFEVRVNGKDTNPWPYLK